MDNDEGFIKVLKFLEKKKRKDLALIMEALITDIAGKEESDWSDDSEEWEGEAEFPPKVKKDKNGFLSLE